MAGFRWDSSGWTVLHKTKSSRIFLQDAIGHHQGFNRQARAGKAQPARAMTSSLPCSPQLGDSLPFFAKPIKLPVMSTMNISLPDELKQFVDQRIQAEGYGTSSEYMRELIRRDRDRTQFRQYVLDGMQSPLVGRVDASYLESLRQRVKKHRTKKK